MADKIKGITVQIGGDTAPLSKALRSVDKEIRSTQANLKEVNKLLKLDPNNTNLLKEKQKLLAEQISKTTGKLDALKKAQQEAKQMLANGEIGQKEYDELAKQIDKCESQLKELEKQQAETTKKMKPNIESISKGFTDVGQSIEDAGKKLAPFSAAAAAGLGAAVKTTADFDSAMSEVAAISGATGDEFDALRTKAREMGENTKFSASESAEALKYMAMAGWKTEDMVDGLEGVLALAAASGEELGATSDIVTDALTAMGYSSKDAAHLADVMAAASSNANTNVSLMGETFKNAASVAGSYGYTMEDIALATGLMANSGIKGAEAGTALRSIMSRLATDAGASSKKLGALGTLTEKLGVAFYNTDGTMRPFRDVLKDVRGKWQNLTKAEQANYAKTIAGQKAMNGWMAIMNSTEEDFDSLADAIDNSTGTAQSMSDTMQDNLGGQLTILKSQLQELAISIGDALMPTIRDIVAWVQKVVDKFNNLDQGTKEMIAKIGVLVAALAPVLLIGGKLISGLGSIIGMIPKILSFLSGVTGPIALVVGGLGLLTAGIIEMVNSEGKAYEESRKLTDEQNEAKKRIDEQAEAWRGVEKARSDAYKDIKNQTKTTEELWKALEKCVDPYGKVIDGKEEEAQILISQLNEALGTELEFVDGQVKGYNDLAHNIDTVIQKKEAEALLAADAENYAEATKNLADANYELAHRKSDVVDQEKEVAKWSNEVDRLLREQAEAQERVAEEGSSAEIAVAKLGEELDDARKHLSGATDKLDELKNMQEDAQETVDKYTSSIANHDKLVAAVASGSVVEMKEAEKDLANSFIDAEHGTKESLERQAKNWIEKYGELRDIVKNTGDENVRNMSYSAGEMVHKAIEELKKKDPALAAELKKQYDMINEKGKEWAQSGYTNAKKYSENVIDAVSGLPGQIEKKLDLATQATAWGKDMMVGYANSITKYSTLVKDAADNAAAKVHKVLGFSEPEEGPLSDFHTYGPDMMKLLAQGINSSAWMVMQAAQGVAGNLKASLESTTLTATLDQKSIPLGTGVTLNITNFNNYSDSDIRELTNEIMQTAAQFAARKGAAFA